MADFTNKEFLVGLITYENNQKKLTKVSFDKDVWYDIPPTHQLLDKHQEFMKVANLSKLANGGYRTAKLKIHKSPGVINDQIYKYINKNGEFEFNNILLEKERVYQEDTMASSIINRSAKDLMTRLSKLLLN